MVENFFKDLEKAKTAEDIVLNRFKELSNDYVFYPIGNIRQYYHRGDILAVDKNGKYHFIEVKDDSCIGTTHNVLCEEEVFYSSTGNYVEGNMYSNYETYCVVSQDKKKIYVIDFKVLKRIYQRGNYKEIRHKDQTTYCFLVPLIMLKNEGGIIAEIDY